MEAPRSWTRQVQSTPYGPYLVSTDASLLSTAFITAAFASADMSWAHPLSPSLLETMLRHSCTLGLYTTAASPSSSAAPESPRPEESSDIDVQNLEQIGMARLITDYVTFAYLTDVYVHGSHRGRGLGKWMVECAGEVIEGVPALRRAMLLTSKPEVGVPLYGEVLGMVECGRMGNGLVVMSTGKRN